MEFLRGRITFLADFAGKQKALTVSVPRWLLALCGLIFLSLIGFGAGTVVHRMRNEFPHYELARLENEHRRIVENYGKLECQADSLNVLLAFMEQHDVQLRIQGNLDVLPADVRKLGIGGPNEESPQMARLRQMRGSAYKQAEQLTRTVEELKRKTLYQQESFAEIADKLDQEQHTRDHTPSIPPAEGHMTSGFGYRIDPFLRCPKLHTGLDIANYHGAPIVATADGAVSFVGYLGGYGWVVKIDHGNGILTMYGHLSTICVKAGQQVSRSEVIGLMGNTGRSTGTHVHYEVRIAGNPVNPINYFLRIENSREINF